MSDQTPAPSPDDHGHAAGAPRQPTEIVVYRPAPGAGTAAGAEWRADRDGFGPAAAAPKSGSGRIAALVAVAALIGAVGGTLAATGLGGMSASQPQAASAAAASAEDLAAMRETVARLEQEIVTLRAEADKANKAQGAQLGKLGERLDKAEKAQGETAGRLARLAEAQEKERKTAAADVTGSVPKAAARPAERPQVVAGWRLNRIVRGGAEVEFDGVRYAVFPGDPLPGIGTVAGLKRTDDGRWALVTPKGLILER